MAVDVSSSDVLIEQNAHLILPIASLTKVMTALVVIEIRRGSGRVRDDSRLVAHNGQECLFENSRDVRGPAR